MNNSISRENNRSSGEHNGFDSILGIMTQEVFNIAGCPVESGVYTAEEQLDKDTKIVVAYRVDKQPGESEAIVSRLKTGPSGLQRQTYRWSSEFPDTIDRQVYQEVNPEAKQDEKIRTEKRGFSEADKEAISFNIAALRSRNG